MKLCPVAIAIGCRRCPVVNVCPVKSLIGDADERPPSKPTPAAPRKH